MTKSEKLYDSVCKDFVLDLTSKLDNGEISNREYLLMSEKYETAFKRGLEVIRFRSTLDYHTEKLEVKTS